VNPCSATCHSTVATTIPEREREREGLVEVVAEVGM